jgi:hypothetical protein
LPNALLFEFALSWPMLAAFVRDIRNTMILLAKLAHAEIFGPALRGRRAK